MSLIQFRGRPILPPLIKSDEEPDVDLQVREDEIILSLPTSEALKAILCGLPDHLKNALKIKDKNDKLMECKDSYKDKIKYGENKNEHEHKIQSTSCKVMGESNNSKDLLNKSSNFTSEHSNEKTTVKEHPFTSSEESKNYNSIDISAQTENSTSPLASKSVIGITNNQKLKALKSSGTDSSSYLQDYLQLLTSRSGLSRVGKSKRETDIKNDVFLERRGSAPLLSGKKYSQSSGRQRNSSGSSDKSSSSRSLGSTYLDSYLGTLTDHSWIIYPTGETAASLQVKLPENSENKTTSLETKDGDYLQRRLRFINPEKFFSGDKSDNIEEPSQSTCVMKSSSSAENDNDQGLTDTSGIVLSPDISSSSLDTDKLDSNAFSTSLQETSDIKESPKSQDLSESKESNLEQSYGTDTSPEDIGLSSKDNGNHHSSNETLSKLNVTFDKEKPEIITLDTTSETTRSSPERLREEEETVDDKSTIGSETTSDISTDDEAEDQVSMIICDVQRSPDEINGSKESLCEDSLASKPTSSISVKDQTCSDSLKSENDSINSGDKTNTITKNAQEYSKPSELSYQESVVPKLITVLKTRQEEELLEMKKRHEWEMKSFMYDLSRLTSSQIHTVMKSYESPNNSYNDIIKIVHNLISGVSHSNNTNDYSNRMRQDSGSLSSSSSSSSHNHVNVMPSFFLHNETQDGNSIKRPDINKISQIFSPSKGNIQNVANFFNISKKQESNDVETRRNTNTTENSKPNEVKKYVSFSPRQFELGLDLVPTRESDGLFTTLPSSTVLKSYHRGICKLQAIVKGKRIRKLMRTSQVQQLLSTLKEVAKLAHQFHQDILMDNIRKGDIGFHKALYNEEQQAREKLIKIMVEMPPNDQIRLIQKDRIIEERENKRRDNVSQVSKVNANHIPRLKFTNNANTAVDLSSNKTQSSPRSILSSPYKTGVKQISRKVYSSELPRPCKANGFSSDASKSPIKYNPVTSPRERVSQPMLQKSVLSKNIPRQRIVKKIDSLPQTHIPPLRRQNTPICKSEIGNVGNVGSKPIKTERINPISFRGDAIPSRKPWR